MQKQTKVEAVSQNIIRVVCTCDGNVREPSCMIEKQPEFNGTCIMNAEETGEQVAITVADHPLLVQKSFSMEKKDIYRYTFSGEKPIIVTKKTVDGERSFVENAETVKIGESYEGTLCFSIDSSEAIYGLGQHEDGIYNYRNVKEYLYQNNMKIPMPVFLSSKNYAVVIDATCMMTYEEKNNVITFTFDACDQIAYYVIAGSSFDELVEGIRTLTGQAVMLPKWAFGYIQSKERYKTQEEILEVARTFKEHEIPVDCIVLDWLSWEDGKWGNKIFDKSRFPDAKAMVDKLHEQGIAFMISVWPNAKEGCENNEDFARKGKLFCNFSTYDAFDEEAREMYWKQCEQELFAAGTDAWWCDSTEPFCPDWNGLEKRPGQVRYDMAKESNNKYMDARVSNIYALKHAQGIYENQRKACSTKRVVNLTRSGSPSAQKYGVIMWSGDIAASWQCLKNQIAEGLSMGMSGIPYWTLDIGAFFVGNTECWKVWANQTEGTAPWFWQGAYEKGVQDKGYCELYTRWLQMGTFLPVMRSHGTDTPREPWNFGEKGTLYYDTIVKYIKFRYRMLPYTYSLAGQVTAGAYTMMRSLMFDFAEDEKVTNIADEFMYGPAFLVCPVTEPMEYEADNVRIHKKQTREVYLPANTLWYDYETKQTYEGGQTIEADAPVSHMPLYVRAGAIIPYAEDTKGTVRGFEVYQGADGGFVLYLDNGQDYAYENGESVSIPVMWSEEHKQLVIGEATGNYPYPHEFMVRLYTTDGRELEQKITYNGQVTRVIL